jgi:hypothetical protein
MNVYAQMKRHSLEQERLARMEVTCMPVRLVRGGLRRVAHVLRDSVCTCHV